MEKVKYYPAQFTELILRKQPMENEAIGKPAGRIQMMPWSSILVASPLKSGITPQLSLITLPLFPGSPTYKMFAHGQGYVQHSRTCEFECALLVSWIWNLFVTTFFPLDGLKQKTFFFVQTEDCLFGNGCQL